MECQNLLIATRSNACVASINLGLKSYPNERIVKIIQPVLGFQAWHEKYCGRFDAPSPDSEEDVTRSTRGRFFFSSDEDDDGGGLFYDFDDDSEYGRKNKDWRETHEDVLNKIRKDRKAYQTKLDQQKNRKEQKTCLFIIFQSWLLQKPGLMKLSYTV